MIAILYAPIPLRHFCDSAVMPLEQFASSTTVMLWSLRLLLGQAELRERVCGEADSDVSGAYRKIKMRCNIEQKMLDRATYKKIKGMTREEMQNFLTNYYNNVIEDAEALTFDLGELRKELGGIKSIGEKRLDEIMAVIEKHLVVQ